ncbi:MAG: VCBS repeat-containing protein, partial [Bryobacteraceae bacterium]|nr:VCBS repeat-containing protein [Bryobacteraceae bacterium]
MRLAIAVGVALAALLAQTSPSVGFVDVALAAGIKDIFYCGGERTKNYIVETLGTGAAFIDYDNDGNVDLFVVNASRLEGFPPGESPTNHLYRNEGKGTFRDVTREAGMVHSGWGQGVCAGDYDNDGFIDLFVTYWGHDVLYKNSGKGSFDDVTEVAGMSGKEVRWGTGCAFVDYNRDGKLDLFVSNYLQFDQKNTPTPDRPDACKWKGASVMCGPRGLKGGVNRLWRNDSKPGSVRFTDVSATSKITAPGERFSLSATTFDYDRDGWPDIYVAVDSQASILYRNKRDGTFADTGLEAGVAYSEDGREQAGMGTAAGDYDGDGHFDLAKTNFIDDTPNIYRNNADGSFTEMTSA